MEKIYFTFSVSCSHKAPSNRIHCMQTLDWTVTTGWTTGVIHIWQFFTYLFTFFLSRKWSQNPQMSLSICILLFTTQKARVLHLQSVWTFVLITNEKLWPLTFTLSECASQSLASWRALRFWYKRHFISTKWKSIIYIHLLLWHFSLDSSSCLSTLCKETGLIYITNILLMVQK